MQQFDANSTGRQSSFIHYFGTKSPDRGQKNSNPDKTIFLSVLETLIFQQGLVNTDIGIIGCIRTKIEQIVDIDKIRKLFTEIQNQQREPKLNIEVIKPGIESYLKSMKKVPTETKDLKGQFNVLQNLIKGQMAKSKVTINANNEEVTLQALKYMLDNNHLEIDCLK